MCLRIKAFALTGRVDSTMWKTQGVASLALGYVHHWAFSPSLLNAKLQLVYIIMFRISRYALAHSFAQKHRFLNEILHQFISTNFEHLLK